MRNLILITLAFINMSLFSEEAKMPKNLESFKEYILWIGADTPEQFNPKAITSSKKIEVLTEKGLDIVTEKAKKGDWFSQAVLADYYFYEKKWYNYSFAYAYKSAEEGSQTGMLILVQSYASGWGVIKDLSQSLKWAIILNMLDGISYQEVLDDLDMKLPAVKQCYAKAKEWAKKHPDIFFMPND